MGTQIASQDGWLRISTRGGTLSVAGQHYHFKGYAVAGGDGVHARWDWDGDRLTARTCPTGFLPLYYYWNGAQLALSTRIADLFTALGTRPRIDHAALGVLLRLGFLVGHHTPFAGVRVLGPQGMLTWRPGAAPEVRWCYPQGERDPTGDVQARYVALFRASMARIADVMTDSFAMPLSGGRDSRHIALELHRMGARPRFALTARHLPPRTNEDVRVAAQLCAAMNWPHRVVRQPVLGQYAQECAHAEAVDFHTFEHAWTLPLAEALLASGVTETFDGVGGDVLSAGLFQDEALLVAYLAGDIAAVRNGLLDQWSQLGGHAALGDTLGPELAALADPGPAVALIDAELERHLGQANPLKSFYFWNRSRRGTGLLPFKILGRHVAYAPYLDQELLAFLLGLAPAVTRGKTLHTETIRLADEAIGSIPYESKSAPATRQGVAQRLGFYVPLLANALAGDGTMNKRFVAPRAAQACLLGGDLQSTWWKPRRVAYLASLGRFLRKFGAVS